MNPAQKLPKNVISPLFALTIFFLFANKAFASNEVHEGSLTVSTGQEYLVENKTFQVNGDLTVEKGARFVLHNSTLVISTATKISSSTVAFIYWLPGSDFEIKSSTVGIFVFFLTDTKKETIEFSGLYKKGIVNYSVSMAGGKLNIEGSIITIGLQFCFDWCTQRDVTIKDSNISLIWTRYPPTKERIKVFDLPNGHIDNFTLSQHITGLTLPYDVHLINTDFEDGFKPEFLGTKAEITNSRAMVHPYDFADVIASSCTLISMNCYGCRRAEIINSDIKYTLQFIDKPGFHQVIYGSTVGVGGYFDFIFRNSKITSQEVIVACATGTIKGDVEIVSPQDIAKVSWVKGSILRTYPLKLRKLDGTPVPGAAVTLLSSGKTISSGTTDANGEYSFDISFDSNTYTREYTVDLQNVPVVKKIGFLTTTPVVCYATAQGQSYVYDSSGTIKEIDTPAGKVKVKLPAESITGNYYLEISTSPSSQSIDLANQSDELDKTLNRLGQSIVEIKVLNSTGTVINAVFNQNAALTLPYPDTDNDGIIDGTDPEINENTLEIYTLANNRWQKTAGSSVDPANNQVTAGLNHFSVFILMGAPAAENLSKVYVYPSPCKSDSDTVTFARISNNTEIKIYNIAGELVRTLKNNGGYDHLKWDLKNENDRKAASGIYIYTASDCKSVQKGKFAIVK
ncbi:MAG: T9SS type A sorting domain-containing protein [Elusimicrobia bacterium]|nr:T9SS type A sorting domain-containing protein [Candidatus Liberimonas magnetica]